MKTRLPLLLASAALLGGCAIFSLLMLPVNLLFGLLGTVGDGVGSLFASVEPLEGPAPELRPEGPGRWAVAAIHPQSRFRVVFEAEGHVPRAYTWPDDFPDVTAGTIEVVFELRPLADPRAAGLLAFGTER